MTIPTLINNYKEKITVTKFKKIYATFSQAFRYATIEKGSPDTWGIGAYNSDTGNTALFRALSPYLNISKACPPADLSCFDVADSNMKDHVYTFILNDGSEVFMFGRSSDCSFVAGTGKDLQNICADIHFSLNGEGGRFWLTKYGIVPKGTSDTTVSVYSFEGSCLQYKYGEACTAWIIYNENMDYKRCDDLSWNGKHKCSD